jgi:hypothetical protein
LFFIDDYIGFYRQIIVLKKDVIFMPK